MRYIKKQTAPTFFSTDTKSIHRWDDYLASKKRELKNYMLEQEQNFLCVYCECKISLDNLDSCHVEHIKPKASNMYPELTFDYQNLAVSCNGTIHNPDDDKSRYSCGHKKANEYSEINFLDPTKVVDIRDHFVYDFDDFIIMPSGKSPVKSQYNIDILRLNSDGLPQARGKALRAFQQHLAKIKDVNKRKEKMIEIINGENKPFVSFLRYKFRALFT